MAALRGCAPTSNICSNGCVSRLLEQSIGITFDFDSVSFAATKDLSSEMQYREKDLPIYILKVTIIPELITFFIFEIFFETPFSR